MSHRREAEGAEAFQAHYSMLFGERWPLLRAALLAPADSQAFVASAGCAPFFLDSASIFAACSLDLPSEGIVLDACAAPGGKSLVIASRLGPGARLVVNDISADRRRRLRDVLDRHLGPDVRSRVELSGRDAAAMCRSLEGTFDAILLDAPCSSERHVLADERELAQWRPARIRGLAIRQWALLSSALIMLKAGGCLVYSTCALSPEENDLVVARAVARYGETLAFERPRYEGSGEAEETEFGVCLLPDRAGAAGPMYVCRMRKLPAMLRPDA